MATHQKKKKSPVITIIIFIIELAVIGGLVYMCLKLFGGNDTPEPTGPSIVVLDKDELSINTEVAAKKENGETNMVGYRNIALFGLDALDTDVSSLYKGFRSDTMMIASINQETGDIKLVSMYRDSYLNLSNDSYGKANSAYSKGGATQAIAMLNMNYDLDITDFVTVSYSALTKVIDGVGGVYIDVDEDELKHINNYQISISDILGTSYNEVTDVGYQKLDGIQAAAYCRIRYTAGSDFKRAERQREVLQAIEDRAKKLSVSSLITLFNEVDDDIYTSLSQDDIVSLITDIMKYNIVDEDGFPRAKHRALQRFGAQGDVVCPDTLADNVIELHQFLFNDEDYTPSEQVKSISDTIQKKLAEYTTN